MKQFNLPAGLDKKGKTLEIYLLDGELRADYKGERISFWHLPEHIIKVFRREMNTMQFIVKKYDLDKIENDNEKLEAYVAATYGIIFNNTPDWDEDNGTHPEITDLDAAKFYGISYREYEVLKLISNGATDQDIAARLNISPFTVQNHRHNILSKTGCKNAADLTRFAITKNITV